MTRLSDTQLVILTAAAQRDDGNVLPLPGSLRGGAATKVVGALLTRGLVAEHMTDSMVQADAALNTFWRNDDAGRAVLLRITAEGLAAIGVEPEVAPQAPDSAPETAQDATTTDEASKTATDATPAATVRRTREGTKQAQLIALLREGATIDEMVAATGWQAHTVRGAMAGAPKKLRRQRDEVADRDVADRLDQRHAPGLSAQTHVTDPGVGRPPERQDRPVRGERGGSTHGNPIPNFAALRDARVRRSWA